MTFKEFGRRVLEAGLRPKLCNPLHWQILGGKYIVNFYPSTRRGPRFYVARAAKGAGGDLSLAIRAAVGSHQVPLRRQQPAAKTGYSIEARWEQHRRDGGALTLQQFSARVSRRKPKHRPASHRKAMAELAADIFDDLPDGAFFAAAHDTFGIDPEDFID